MPPCWDACPTSQSIALGVAIRPLLYRCPWATSSGPFSVSVAINVASGVSTGNATVNISLITPRNAVS